MFADFRQANQDPSLQVWRPQGAPTVDTEKLGHFKNTEINLALPHFKISTPATAVRHNFQGRAWTEWERIDVNEELTLQQLLDRVRAEYGITVT